MASVLVDRPAGWLTAEGPESEVVVCSYGYLLRNLRDFAFPERCTADERGGVEERVVDALSSLDLLRDGKYYRVSELEKRELRFLEIGRAHV